MVSPFFIDHVGKGYASVSNVKDSRSLFINPACILQAPDEIYGLEISYANSKLVNEIFLNSQGVYNRTYLPIKEVIDNPTLAVQRYSNGEPLADVKNEYGNLYLGLPIYTGFKYKNIQIVAFHYVDMSFKTYLDYTLYQNTTGSHLILPANLPFFPGASFDADVYADVKVTDDIGIATGFSFPIPVQFFGSKWEYLYFGFTVKIFQRVIGVNPKIPLSEVSNMSNPLDFINDKLNPGRAISITSDYGLFYKYRDFGAGVTFYNLLSMPLSYKPTKAPSVWESSTSNEIYYNSLPKDIGVGVSYKFPHIGRVSEKLIRDLTLSLEGNDFFNSDYPKATQKIRAGMEIILADSVSLRMGFLHQNFTFGIGYNFFMIKINAAYWREKIRDYNVTNLGMSFSLDF